MLGLGYFYPKGGRLYFQKDQLELSINGNILTGPKDQLAQIPHDFEKSNNHALLFFRRNVFLNLSLLDSIEFKKLKQKFDVYIVAYIKPAISYLRVGSTEPLALTLRLF